MARGSPPWPGRTAHLAHGLRVGGGGGEVAVPVEAAKQAAPAVVAVGGVGQAPGHQWLALWEEGRGDDTRRASAPSALGHKHGQRCPPHSPGGSGAGCRGALCRQERHGTFELYRAYRTLYFSRLGSALTISSSTRQSAPGTFLGMHLEAAGGRGGGG